MSKDNLAQTKLQVEYLTNNFTNLLARISTLTVELEKARAENNQLKNRLEYRTNLLFKKYDHQTKWFQESRRRNGRS